MRLPESDMIKVMLALGDYIHAYETAHHHRIVADRVRELRDKLALRSERFETQERTPAHTIAERPPQPPTQTPPQLQAIPGGAQRPMRTATTPNPTGNRSHLTPLRADKEAV